MARRMSGGDEELDGVIAVVGGGEGGTVWFVELDAEGMGEYFGEGERFDGVWVSEALSHFPDKGLFFGNAWRVLGPGGKLVVADWFRGEGLGEGEVERDIRPIERLCARFFHLVCLHSPTCVAVPLGNIVQRGRMELGEVFFWGFVLNGGC